VTPNGTKADYCGYHTYATTSRGVTVKIGFIVADADQLSVCTFANGGPYDDVSNSAITTLAHEIIETITDPEPNPATIGYAASFKPPADPYTPENGDMCANINFNEQTLPNGRKYTTYIGPNPYYLQANINPVTSCCGFPTSVVGNSLAASPAANSAPASVTAPPSLGLSAAPTGPATAAPSAGSISNSPYGTFIYPSDAPTTSYEYYGSYCGDGVVDAGEKCDPGYYYFGGASCCNYFCQYKDIGAICDNVRQGVCYRIPRCARNRTTGKVYCQRNKYRRAGVPCRLPGSNTANGVCNARGACNPPRVVPT
jgi:hypothetical protein